MKNMKRIGCLLLVLAMCLALGVSAFADESSQTLASSPEDKGEIHIYGEGIEDYSIYQILALTYADDESSYSYTVVSPWEKFLSGYPAYFTLVTVDNVIYLDPSSAVFQEEDSSDFMVSFAKAALAWAEDESNGVTATATKTSTKNSSTADSSTGLYASRTVFDDLDLGWYLVSSSLGTLCMLDSATASERAGYDYVAITDKNSVPVISKYVKDTEFEDEDFEGSDDAQNNDTLEYKLVVENVANVKNVVIHDYLDEQLSLETVADMSVVLHSSSTDTEGTSLEVINEGEEVGEAEYYCFCATTNTCEGEDCGLDGCSFEISIPDAFLDGLDSTAYIEVIYDVTVSEDLEDFEDLVDEIDNWAGVSFGKGNYSTPAEAETYSFGFEVYKYTYLETVEATALSVASIGNMFTNVNSSIGVKTMDLTAGTYVITGLLNFRNFENFQDWCLVSVAGEAGNYEVVERYYISQNADGEMVVTLTEDGTYVLSAQSVSSGNWNYSDHTITIGDSVELAGDMVSLAGAEFTLQNSSEQYAYFLQDGEAYLFEGWTNDPDKIDSSYTVTLVSAADGMIYVEGLHDGTYTLTETAAPDGYNMLSDSITVTIDATGSVTFGGGIASTSNTKQVNVLNNSGSMMPSTGGIGTTIFYVIGAILVCGAVVLLVSRKRLNRENG